MKKINRLVKILKKKLEIKYTPEEKEAFRFWLSHIPGTAFKEPILVKDWREALSFLPSIGSYKEFVSMSFIKISGNAFSLKDMHYLLRGFSENKPNYEISVFRNKKIMEVVIGNKENSGWGKGEWFGHYHPLQIMEKVIRDGNVPEIFLTGLLPSGGDIHGFYINLRYRKESRIYSSSGYSKIRLVSGIKDSEESRESLDRYSVDYLEMFLGENSFNLVNIRDWQNYYREKFGLAIKFYLYSKNPLNQ